MTKYVLALPEGFLKKDGSLTLDPKEAQLTYREGELVLQKNYRRCVVIEVKGGVLQS